LGIAIAALYESQKASRVLLKVKKCSFEGTKSANENNQDMFFVFRIVVQNRGISLHTVCMSLSFVMENGGGMVNIPLMRKHLKECNTDEFARGMIGEFYLKSCELDEAQKKILCVLKNSKKQNACLCVYSQDYLAKCFEIWKLSEAIKMKWNSLAIRVNTRFERRVGTNPEGMPVVKSYRILPVLTTIKPHIMSFIESLRGR